jgi:hypothetical protein
VDVSEGQDAWNKSYTNAAERDHQIKHLDRENFLFMYAAQFNKM